MSDPAQLTSETNIEGTINLKDLKHEIQDTEPARYQNNFFCGVLLS